MLTGPQLKAYFERIGLPEVFGQHNVRQLMLDFPLLRRIMLQHALSIPFENMDMHNVLLDPTRIAPSIALEDIFNKLIEKKRGGYCYETNELLRQVLLSLGFDVKTYSARVMWLKDKKTYPYHQILLVTLGEQEYLIEPGFGAPGPVEPLLFREKGQLCTHLQQFPTHDIKRFRFIIDEDGEFQLQSAAPTPFPWHPECEFKPLYTFTATKLATQEELSESNYMVSVSEQSPFLARLFVTQAILVEEGVTGRKTLTDKMFKVSTPDGIKEIKVASEAHFFELLHAEFGITLPKGSSLTARQVRFEEPAPSLDRLQALLSTPASSITVAGPQSLLTPAYAAQSPIEGQAHLAMLQSSQPPSHTQRSVLK
ncbi:MAG: arylamine N-acetyltransferase [Proteobacteria bacterium]|nr:arylamine N-acetyltransferase [Pseudomonadota bacterium]